MKRKIFNTLTVILCLFVLLELLIKKSLIYDSVLYALNMWVKNLIPALFPFFIISDILINYNITAFIPKFIRNLCKYIWGISDNMFTILILSMISGFPSNARNTRMMYDKGLLTLEEANHILIFSHFSNPIFILTTVGLYFFGNEKIGIIILISHYVSNFILGIIFRGKFSDIEGGNNTLSKQDFGGVLIKAIQRAIDTILLICGIVVVFLMLSSILVNLFNFNIYNSMIIKGIFEITIGIEALSRLDVNIVYKAVIASCFLSFGGLSVHMQVISQITGTNIKYRYFLIGRIWQTVISLGITYLLMII